MKVKFTKYQGTGNDFIVIDNMSGQISCTKEQIQKLCNRKWGIGSDGLILIEKSDQADFYVNFYNPDGSVSFCGNGSRCAAHFAFHEKLATAECQFDAVDGLHSGVVLGDMVDISMKDVTEMIEHRDGLFLNTGSPHLIVLVDEVDKVDLLLMARNIRYSATYKADGINVNVVERNGKDAIRMRTYERGVEDETLSCGTGVTAAALSVALEDESIHQIEVETRGGNLSVRFDKNDAGGFRNIWLKGPVAEVFEGEITL